MKKILALSLLILSQITGAYATSIKASTFGWNATDATTAFQNAIKSSFDTVIINLQAGDWIVGPNIFTNISNKTIIFESGVVLLAKPGAYPDDRDCLLEFKKSNNLKIYGYGATLKMQKAEYTSGEWRMGLAIRGGTNIQVYGLKIIDSGGDGVIVSGIRKSEGGIPNFSEYILLKDLWSDNHRRQGLSVISAQHLKVEHCWFTNTTGTAPAAGVDLEPDNNTQRLIDIVFDKCRFTGNLGAGILIIPQKLDNTSLPIDVTFNNCYSSGNKTGQEILLGRSSTADLATPVTGTVKFNNCMTENINWNANSVTIGKMAYEYKAIFNNCIFINPKSSPIKFSDNSITGSPRYGGVAFNNCLISYNNTANFIETTTVNPPSAGMGNVQFNNVTVINSNTVTYNAVSPASDCVFDFQKLNTIPATTVTYTLGSSIIECNTTNSILKTNRASGSNITYPIGISYDITGTGIQGVDYSRMAGFEIIKQGSLAAVDTFFVLKDAITESVKNATVTVSASNLFTTTSSPKNATILDCISTGIVNEEIYHSISVYPNPFHSNFNIIISPETVINDAIIKIYDVCGKEVKTISISNNETNIDRGELKSGIYFYTIINNNSTIAKGKLIVQD
ncbi:MAG: T9SS type A sorting domain-containing protein [Bacteroidota bacterium]